MSKPTVGAGWQRAVVTLAGTVVGVVVIGTLYWAQSVFIPVALAVFLTFLLGPMVNRFHQFGLPRAPAVVVSVLLTAAVLGGIGWMVTDQISSLLEELPRYRQTVKRKVETIKQVAEGPRQVRGCLTTWARKSHRRTGRVGRSRRARRCRRRRRPWSSSRSGPPGCRGCQRSSARCSNTSASWPWRSSWLSSCC